MSRREAMQAGAAAVAGALLGANAQAQASKLRVLILGGTGFIGPHFVAALEAGGNTTLFNRGRRNPGSISASEAPGGTAEAARGFESRA